MRIAFQKTLQRALGANSEIMLLTGDLGYSVFEPIRDEFPDQYVNCGVAEQGMMSIAAGLALSGKTVFAYSIVPFASMRAFEQVRDDIAYQNLSVKVVGVGQGFSYGHMGVTHYALEDVAIMRALPNLTVVCPADPLETEAVMDFAVQYSGPMYIRLGKAGENNVCAAQPDFIPGRFAILEEGQDVAIFAAGPIAAHALAAGTILRAEGISCRIIAASSVKPVDKETIARAAADCRLLISVEEHSVIGGLGSALAEVLAEDVSAAPLVRLGVPDEFPKTIGSQDYLRDHYGLTPSKIAESVRHYLRKRSP